ncbi:long-chain-fatty-acid-CoA ligase [Dentipellis sp. KUC8613]|nr:long-chain-fatty-acid-CoA ligase [Dentipellis sp. KUC8613]
MTDSTWTPKRTIDECRAILQAPGSPVETELALVHGRLLRVFKNAEPNLRSFFLTRAELYADRDYFVFENERYTYGRTRDAALDVANTLWEVHGVRKGDRVAISMRNVPEFLISFWAVAILGGVPTMLNAWLTDAAFEHCLLTTSPKVALIDPERADKLEPMLTTLRSHSRLAAVIVARPHESKSKSKSPPSWRGMQLWNDVFTGSRIAAGHALRAPACLPDDDASIFFTSGTTALPKAVLSTQRAFVSCTYSCMFAALLAVLRRGEDIAPPPPPKEAEQKAFLLTAPLFHMACTMQGMKVVAMRKVPGRAATRLCARERIAGISGVPTVITDIVRSQLPRRAGAQIEMLSTGSAPMPATLKPELARAFPGLHLMHAYGMTETTSVVAVVLGEDATARSPTCGIPSPICDILIIDPATFAIQPPGGVGELWVRGPNVMREYVGDAAATRKALTADGWFRTGDLAVVDEEGFVYLKDRAKDIIIRGGEKIHSTQIEDALRTHPAVLDAAAVGIPDARLGELVAGIVSVSVSANPSFNSNNNNSVPSEREIVAWTRKVLPPHAVPAIVLVQRSALEYSATGKLDKKALKRRAGEAWRARMDMRTRL